MCVSGLKFLVTLFLYHKSSRLGEQKSVTKVLQTPRPTPALRDKSEVEKEIASESERNSEPASAGDLT